MHTPPVNLLMMLTHFDNCLSCIAEYDSLFLRHTGTYACLLTLTHFQLAKSDQLKRYWHSSTSFPVSSDHIRVILFGGISKLLQNSETFSKSSGLQKTLVVDLSKPAASTEK